MLCRWHIFFPLVDIISWRPDFYNHYIFWNRTKAALRLQRYMNMVDRSYQKIHNGKKTKESLYE